jgi:UDPglucose 6-dehydrogenase
MSDYSNRQSLNVANSTIGLGHIGLLTALGLTELGHRVIGADNDRCKVGSICAGNQVFFEPGLAELLTKHLQSGRFQPVDDLAAAVRSGSIIFISVGTPQKANGQADLGQVEAVAGVVACNLNGY